MKATSACLCFVIKCVFRGPNRVYSFSQSSTTVEACRHSVVWWATFCSLQLDIRRLISYLKLVLAIIQEKVNNPSPDDPFEPEIAAVSSLYVRSFAG